MDYKNPQAHEWYIKNKAKRKAYMENYYANHRGEILRQKKQYLTKPEVKEHKKKYNAEYRKRNYEQIRQQKRIYDRKYERINKDNRRLKDLKLLRLQAKPFNLSSYEFKHLLQIWSICVRKKDNYKCQICLNDSKESHHIIFRNKFPSMSLILNNGISLCVPCHKEIHKLNGY